MLQDPLPIQSDGSFHDFVRVGSNAPDRLGRFVSPDGNYEFAIRQDKSNNRFRREIRITRRKVAADPVSAVNKEVSASVILAFDEPRWGFTDADLVTLLDAITVFANHTNALRVLTGEL